MHPCPERILSLTLNAQVYRAMAVVGSQGLGGTLPPYCGRLALLFFFFTLALNIARDVAPPRYRRYMPVPMAIGECRKDVPTGPWIAAFL